MTPTKLEKALGSVVESCVNAVGIDVNTASPYLLQANFVCNGLMRRSNDLENRRAFQ